MRTVCLTMIVKNEAHVIERCLRSVRHLVDRYVIVDTGSTDGTQKKIRELGLALDLPGTVVDRPWKDFATSRNEGLEIARASGPDFLLVLDADDIIEGERREFPPDADCLSLVIHNNGTTYERAQIFRASKPFFYKGSVHEYLDCETAFKGYRWPYLRYVCAHDGGRTREHGLAKFERDAAILKSALVDEPDNARHAYYLGQCLRDAGKRLEAIDAFYRRVEMVTGDEEERWFALFQIARLRRELDDAPTVVVHAYLEAFEARPARLEPLFELGRYLEEHERYTLAYHLTKHVQIVYPESDTMFVDRMVYDWGMKDVVAIAAHFAGDTRRARELCVDMLDSGKLPPDQIERVAQNYVIAARNTEEQLLPETLPAAREATPFFGEWLTALRGALAPGGGELGLGVSLFALAISIRAESVIEIGRFRGLCTFALASALRFLTEESWQETNWQKCRSDTDYERHERVGGVRKVYSVDLAPTSEAHGLIDQHNLSKYVGFFDIASLAFERDMLLNAHKTGVDLLVIDGDRTREGISSDLRHFIPMLRAGGYFVLPGRFRHDAVRSICEELGAHVLVDTGYTSFAVFRKVAT